ncbi:I intron endonuclease [Moumouvirus goulette]|uniref:I intron endonuclease n=1 Tax=Moumouvirus goulette TaxID=1247379 RepID=M1PHA7_9VIRU|nr:I intron endonuclease [Moumouvirus goulette]AGF85448.1 I intron endonuclease [Moumouvirus goulette]
MANKNIFLNDLYLEIDKETNGKYYIKETSNTGVIYRIMNIKNGKSYIGKTKSFGTNGIKKGSVNRFKAHWNKSCINKKDTNDCPIFYDELRKTGINDWFVFVLHVCNISELKYYETYFIKLYKTSDPNFGYNYFVGNNKPNSEKYLVEYKIRKRKQMH